MKIRIISLTMGAAMIPAWGFAVEHRRSQPGVDLESATTAMEALEPYIYTPAQARLGTTKIITHEALIKDLTFMKLMLPNAYAGYDRASKHGFDWELSFAKLEAALDPISETAFHWQEKLTKHFVGLPDSHFAVIIRDQPKDGQKQILSWIKPGLMQKQAYTTDLIVSATNRILQGYDGDGSLVSCDGFELKQLLRPTITLNGIKGFRPIVLGKEANPTLACTVQDVHGGKQRLEYTWHQLNTAVISPLDGELTGPLSDDVFDIRWLEGRGALVRIRSFYSRHSEVWERFKASASDLRDAEKIVIDMRGNRGGNSQPFLTWLANLTGRYDINGERFRVLRSPLAKMLTINFFTEQLALNVGDAAWQDHCRLWRQRYLTDLQDLPLQSLSLRTWDHYQPHPADSFEAKPEQPPLAFHGKIIVAVDRQCASACELALKALKSLPNVTVIGENTAGEAVIGENGEVQLPGSGIRLFFGQWIESDLAENFKGFEEGQGFFPDFWLDFSKSTNIIRHL